MNDPPTDTIAAARRSYAEELRLTAQVRSPAVIAAFATVPRERFVGPGSWLLAAARNRASHLGCGTGYYTAIIAELVGPTG